MSSTKNFVLFIDQAAGDQEATLDKFRDDGLLKLSAGTVYKDRNRFTVGYQTNGAEETFSIGQPVFDKDWNLMGYLGISLYSHLDYADRVPGRNIATGEPIELRVPVEEWAIENHTPRCEEGKAIYTYWQYLEAGRAKRANAEKAEDSVAD
jgi:hypothetical protein